MESLDEQVTQAASIGGTGQSHDPDSDSGLLALVHIAKEFDIAVDSKQMWHVHGRSDEKYQSIDIIRCAKRIGLRASVVSLSSEEALADAAFPFIARYNETGTCYVVTSYEAGFVRFLNPLTGRFSRKPASYFLESFSNQALLFARQPGWFRGEKSFGFSWFVPSIIKHLGRFRRLLLASLFIQIFALASPKFFEVVIDKVLVSRGLQSLDVLAIGLLVIAFFDPLMAYIRSLIFAHLASGVNAELSSRLFRHLVHLPLSYFRTRQSGDIIARIREMDHIRNFLTGSALMMVVDLAFIGVFLAFMYAYSSKLFYIVLATLVVFASFWLCVGPFLRKRVEKEYERHADNTAFLTESVTGIETIKSLGIGGRFTKEWEEKLGASLKASFRSDMFGQWAGGAIGLIQKISSALILWFGVTAVLDGDLTVGQLIAFNMYAGHVTMPILRLAQIWQDFQHTGISIRRIGDILREEPESVMSAGRSSLDKIEGEIELRKVSFRYTDDGAEVLRRLDLKVGSGEVLGITGLSGSGKSTITKLVQRLYTPQSGQILIDNVDMAMADPAMLRRRMGVVLQENFLFNGSVRENISLGNPMASEADIEQAAELAGVTEFIQSLPQGYDTQVGERGGALSGGQRQRIAIARALVADPKILIFDEATSALDYETEAAILKRLPEIVKGRTVLIIAHRLNCMPLCDRIIVMEHGEVIQSGDHTALVGQTGAYQELWQLQNESVLHQ